MTRVGVFICPVLTLPLLMGAGANRIFTELGYSRPTLPDALAQDVHIAGPWHTSANLPIPGEQELVFRFGYAKKPMYAGDHASGNSRCQLS